MFDLLKSDGNVSQSFSFKVYRIDDNIDHILDDLVDMSQSFSFKVYRIDLGAVESYKKSWIGLVPKSLNPFHSRYIE